MLDAFLAFVFAHLVVLPPFYALILPWLHRRDEKRFEKLFGDGDSGPSE